MSKTQKILNALEAGKSLTPAQIKGQYGLSNPHDPIMRLRRKGHCIYSTSRELHDGRQTVQYSIGQPSKAIVAHAARHCGNELFG